MCAGEVMNQFKVFPSWQDLVEVTPITIWSWQVPTPILKK